MLRIELDGQEMTFDTGEGLFAPSGADTGTLCMLAHIKLEPGERVLDLGCGWGLVGVYASRICGAENVVLSDINVYAVQTARANLARNGVDRAKTVVSDGFRQLDETGFQWILSNPPYHTDFSVARHFIEKGFNRLLVGGKMVMVTKRLEWYRNKLTAIFGGVRVFEQNGYYVFISEKRSMQYAGKKRVN